MDISSYASLFEVSVGLLAVSGFINENMKISSEELNGIVRSIYESKEKFSISDEVSDHVDFELNELENRLDDLIEIMNADTSFYKMLTIILMGLPLIFLYLIGTGYNGVDYFWLHIALFLSVLGGPIIIWHSRSFGRAKFRKFKSNAAILQRCVTTNQVILINS